MFKFVAFAAFIAVAAAKPGVLHAEPSLIEVREPTIARVGEFVESVPSAISHQSSTVVHNRAKIVTPIVAPAVRTHLAPVRSWAGPEIRAISTPEIRVVTGAFKTFAPELRTFTPEFKVFAPELRTFAPELRAFAPELRSFAAPTPILSAYSTPILKSYAASAPLLKTFETPAPILKTFAAPTPILKSFDTPIFKSYASSPAFTYGSAPLLRSW